MPIVDTKEKFIKELKKFTGDNIFTSFKDDHIVIEETEEDGQGRVLLDISDYKDENIFFVKIEHKSSHTIGRNNNHNDGIVMKVNLDTQDIEVLLFELKKTLRFNKLETASKQLFNAYTFIKYLQLEECFQIVYKFYICYKANKLERDIDTLKDLQGYHFKLFEAVYEKKDQLPLMVPFCEYKEFEFYQIEFGETIRV
ncbi:MAG: hypothetical protein DSY46_07805 [Hydrogenimonas sp.]|nr:MAG: hypothetical protein DSY46_07805 [Hydrogenimonas sp.]